MRITPSNAFDFFKENPQAQVYLDDENEKTISSFRAFKRLGEFYYVSLNFEEKLFVEAKKESYSINYYETVFYAQPLVLFRENRKHIQFCVIKLEPDNPNDKRYLLEVVRIGTNGQDLPVQFFNGHKEPVKRQARVKKRYREVSSEEEKDNEDDDDDDLENDDEVMPLKKKISYQRQIETLTTKLAEQETTEAELKKKNSEIGMLRLQVEELSKLVNEMKNSKSEEIHYVIL